MYIERSEDCDFVLFQKEIEQKRRRKSKAQFFEMIREVRRYQQEEKEIAAEEEDQVAQDAGGEGVGDDDEEEDPYHAGAAAAEEEEEETEDSSIRVVVVPAVPSTVGFVDDERVSYGASRRPPGGIMKHSLSSVTDPGFVVDSSQSSRPSDSERKWRLQTKRRRSFSADALCCETAVQRRRHQGI